MADQHPNKPQNIYQRGKTWWYTKVVGGRRLRALQHLAAKGDIEKAYSVPCRIIASDNQIGTGMANYAANVLKVKSVAVIDDRTAFGQGVAQEERSVRKAGMPDAWRTIPQAQRVRPSCPVHVLTQSAIANGVEDGDLGSPGKSPGSFRDARDDVLIRRLVWACPLVEQDPLAGGRDPPRGERRPGELRGKQRRRKWSKPPQDHEHYSPG